MNILNKSRLSILTALLSAAWLIQLCISLPLWLSTTRTFPYTPIFSFLSLNVGDGGNFILFASLVLSLAGLCISALFLNLVKWRKYFGFSTLIVLALVILQDVMRLQAWVYHYFIILSVLTLYFHDDDEGKATDSLRLVIIFTYLWSGLHKINIHFPPDVFEWLMGIYKVTTPIKDNVYAAYSLAAFEALMGIVLCFRVTWKVMFGVVVIFHICAVTTLYGDSWNYVVYPWNVMMVTMVGLLFFNNPLPTHLISKAYSTILVILLLGLMPILNIFGYWDASLSLTMYSGVTVEGVLYWDEVDDNCIPEDAQSEIRAYDESTRRRMYIDDWTYKSLQTPAYANETVYEYMAKDFCSCVKDTANAGVEIARYPRFAPKVKHYVHCHDILNNTK